MNPLQKWLAEAAPREQLTLGLGAVALVIYLLFAAVLDPLNNRLNQQLERNKSSEEALQRMRAMAAQWINREQGNGGSRGTSIVELVDRSMRNHNLKMSGMQPSGSSDVRLRMDQVNFDNLLAWLYDMEIGEGVQIRDISVASGSESGAVAVNVRLHKE